MIAGGKNYQTAQSIGIIGLILLSRRRRCYSWRVFENKDLGAAIRELRGSRQQKDLASRADVTPATWSRWENGHQAPNKESFAKIAQALDCTSEQLAEKAWQSRRWRLRRESAVERTAPPAGEAEPPTESDPFRKELRRRLGRVFKEVEELFLLGRGDRR